nr:EOG090X0B17 [Eulimnadia texana]
MKEGFIAVALWLIFLTSSIVCPPVDPKKPTPAENAETNEVPDNSIDEINLEYNRYLKEVVQVLESDPDFRKKLEGTDPDNIRSGQIAKELEYVNHNVRTKLDELKRQELERLRHLAIQEYERSRGLGIPHPRPKAPTHLDHSNLETFEIEDLRKLIVQTTKDLDEADRKRKQEFKEYEMQKEFEHREKLKQLDEQKRKEEEQKWEEARKKHKEHPKMHHPGSKQQLEEVWQEQDHMDPESFNPKTFFALHDLDGNGVWDADEVKTLFAKELDKVYDPNAPEDDMAERYEEMERMREHVFNETDLNQDRLISYQEFLDQTRKNEFERDPGWQTLDEQPVYSEQEFMEFERRRQEEIHRLVQQGLITPEEAAYHQQQIPMQYQQQYAAQQPIPPQQYGQYQPQQSQYVQYQGQQQQFKQPPPPLQQQQQVPVAQKQPPVAQQQVPAVQQQVPVAQQEVPVAQQQQVPVAQQQQVPVAQQPVPVVQQQVPVPQQQVPVAQQQVPAAQHQQQQQPQVY